MILLTVGNGQSLNMGSQSISEYQLDSSPPAGSLDFSLLTLFNAYAAALDVRDGEDLFLPSRIRITDGGITVDMAGSGLTLESDTLVFERFRLESPTFTLKFSVEWDSPLDVTPLFDNLGMGESFDDAVVDLVGEMAGVGWEIADGNSGSTLNGDARADILRGNGGADKLRGLAGADRLYGGSGEDRLDGGSGRDVLNGGEGADRFVFASRASGDRVEDFRRGQGDRIVLDNDFLAVGAPADTLGFRFARSESMSLDNRVDAGVRILYDTDSGRLYYDPDGGSGAGRVLLATLPGAPTLGAADFSVVG